MGLPSETHRVKGVICLFLLIASVVLAQGGYNDDRIMIQGFMWESHQEGTHTAPGNNSYTVHWKKKWYEHVKSKIDEIADADFDLIWLPPPSQGEGAGYHPQELYNFDNNYGTLAQHQNLLLALKAKGIEPIADIVINHRNGTGGWSTFRNPDWPVRYICTTDEFWQQDPDTNNSLSQEDKDILRNDLRGGADYQTYCETNWSGARDLDHTNPDLRNEIKQYLQKLKDFGYNGWRYDYVKGFDPVYIAEYNYDSQPTFAVGEYWDENPNAITEWIDKTKMQGQPDPALHACSAFDFATQKYLREFIGHEAYTDLRAVTFQDGLWDGLIAINSNKAVTFLENHDTGFPQKQFDSFSNDDKLMQAYAFILTHPGLPCVYWKHYFEWNRGSEIKALMRARKKAGIHSGSFIKTEAHGRDYVAIVGDRPTDSSTLIVKIGPDMSFQPDMNVWKLETSGHRYAVWIRR